MDRVVARVGRAHGLHGEVTVEVRTDIPERRFVVGSVLGTDPADRGPLTVSSARDHNGVLLLGFDGVDSREAAEGLRGTTLVVEAGSSDEPDAWDDHELVGLAVRRPDGSPLGQVVGLLTGGAQDLLEVRPGGGGENVLVPFVSALVPVVDVTAGFLVVDPPGGMFDAGESS